MIRIIPNARIFFLPSKNYLFPGTLKKNMFFVLNFENKLLSILSYSVIYSVQSKNQIIYFKNFLKNNCKMVI